MADHDGRRGTLEEVMRLLEPSRAELASIERPSFEEKRVDGYPIIALSATKTALTVAIVREEPPEGIRDPRASGLRGCTRTFSSAAPGLGVFKAALRCASMHTL